MIFPTITIELGREGLEKRRKGEHWNGSSFVRWIGKGERFSQDCVDALFAEIDHVRRGFGIDQLPTNRGKDFEGHATELVHRRLELDIGAATAREFWLWLTLVAADGKFADIVDWRFGAKSPIEDVNYGIGRKSEIWEGLFARLWLRGNIGFDSSLPDPYAISKRGSIDIWRSHIIRQEYGRCPSLARALIRYQHPDEDPDSSTLTVRELRELAKRLRIVDASVSYEVLSDADLRETIKRNVDIARSAIETARPNVTTN